MKPPEHNFNPLPDHLKLKALVGELELDKRKRALKSIETCLSNFPNMKKGENYEVRMSLFFSGIATLTGSMSEYLPREFNSEVSKFIDDFKSKPGDYSDNSELHHANKEELITMRSLLQRAKEYIERKK